MNASNVMMFQLKSRSAFTLVELMVSIFLLLLVMVGVNTVFSTTSATIGAGQAQSSLTRDSRAAYAVMSQDFTNSTIVNNTDSPFIIISNMRVNAYQNVNDFNGDPTKNFTATPPGVDSFDPDQDGVETAVKPAIYNNRSHRVDTFQFFARGQFPRQTGGIFGTARDNADQPFTAPQTGTEAWIWYGHLRLPRNDGEFWANPPTRNIRPDPGLHTPDGNQNNYYASQWILGRVAVILADKDLDTPISGASAGKIYDKYAKSQIYINRNWSDGTAGTTSDFGPFNYGSGSNPTGIAIEESRIDLAAVSISKARVRLAKMIAAQGAGFNWWSSITGSTYGQRFQCNPFVMRPLTSETVAAQFPVFLKGCSQFIVEFAGDFIIQNWDPDGNGTPDETTDLALANYGAISGPGQDGRIDTIVLGTGLARRQVVRWYGMPRNVDTSDDTASTEVISSVAATTRDVVPVRDIAGAQLFEKVTPAIKTNYADGTSATSGLLKGDEYRCVWGPEDAARPKMIRIVVNIVDSENRIPDGQNFEYVFNCN